MRGKERRSGGVHASHMKRLALFLALAFSIHAADAPPKWKKLNPRTPAGFTLKTIEVEKHPEHNVELYVYVPDAPGSYPCIIDIHGGGWKGGQRDAAREINIGTTFATHGYVCLSIDYQLDDPASPTICWPQNLHDCKTAVRWMGANAERLHLDADRIGVIGGCRWVLMRIAT